MGNSYLPSTIKQFKYYKSLGDKTIALFSLKELQWKPNSYSNSIAIIVKHITGNMLSRWTNFLTEDGEKEWRNRDQEFEDTYTSKEEILKVWETAWNCLFDAILPLHEEEVENIIYKKPRTYSNRSN